MGGSATLGLQRTVEIEIFDDITTNPPTRFTTNGVGLVEVILPIIPSSSLNLGLMGDNIEVHHPTACECTSGASAT